MRELDACDGVHFPHCFGWDGRRVEYPESDHGSLRRNARTARQSRGVLGDVMADGGHSNSYEREKSMKRIRMPRSPMAQVVCVHLAEA